MIDTRTWNVVGIHGQPPPNTLIDVAPVGLTVSVMQTAAVPDLRPATKWRLSDLPPLDAVQPAPAPGRPEPHGIGLDGRCDECDGPPSIPIGGWFDPGDGRTLQRVTCPTERIPDCALIHYENNGVHPGLVGTTCSPLTEREAMERIYPVGTWLRDNTGDEGIVVAWDDDFGGPGCTAEWARDGEMENSAGWIREHCTVLPGPPLPAPWRPLDELPEDGKVLAWHDTGTREIRHVHWLRSTWSQWQAWADLDDVAPIPAHLRSTP